MLTPFQLGRYQALAGLEGYPDWKKDNVTDEFYDEWMEGWFSLEAWDFERAFGRDDE